MRAKSLQSCPTLYDPMDCSLPGSSVHGLLQARILEWVALHQGIFPTRGSNPHLLCLLHWQVGSSPLAPPGKPMNGTNSNSADLGPGILLPILPPCYCKKGTQTHTRTPLSNHHLVSSRHRSCGIPSSYLSYSYQCPKMKGFPCLKCLRTKEQQVFYYAD